MLIQSSPRPPEIQKSSRTAGSVAMTFGAKALIVMKSNGPSSDPVSKIQELRQQLDSSAMLPTLEALVAFKYPLRKPARFQQEGLESMLATTDFDASNHQVGSLPMELPSTCTPFSSHGMM
eukprot:gene30733-35769_t